MAEPIEDARELSEVRIELDAVLVPHRKLLLRKPRSGRRCAGSQVQTLCGSRRFSFRSSSPLASSRRLQTKYPSISLGCSLSSANEPSAKISRIPTCQSCFTRIPNRHDAAATKLAVRVLLRAQILETAYTLACDSGLGHLLLYTSNAHRLDESLDFLVELLVRGESPGTF